MAEMHGISRKYGGEHEVFSKKRLPLDAAESTECQVKRLKF